MTPRPLHTLMGTDAQIFDLLVKVVAIGRVKGTWREADVARVAEMLLRPGTPVRKPDVDRFARAAAEANEKLRRRVLELERQVRERDGRLDAEVYLPHSASGRPAVRSVLVSPLTARILDCACRGNSPTHIAEDLGMSRSAVSNHMSRAADAMDADSTAHALALVNRGIVAVLVRERIGV